MSDAHIEHFKQCLLWHDETLELLLFFNDSIRNLLKNWIIRRDNSPAQYLSECSQKERLNEPVTERHFVEETFVGRRTNAKMASVVTL